MNTSNPSSAAAPLRRIATDQILHRLREMFGADRAELMLGDNFRVADEAERVVAFPRDITELSEIMQLAVAERWRVIPAGAGTWLEMGNQPVEMHLIVSTARMNRVLEYEPADLTATVEAGCTLAAFNHVAARHRQFIPLDPFGDPSATLGGIVATASSGALRCAYGTPRDWLIGLRVVHADGHITQAGGKVVKNVAGYDLCKLYTGSFGSLVVIAEMSFKLRALPMSEKTLVFYSADEEEAINLLCLLAVTIGDSDVQPAAMELVAPASGADWALEPDHYSLVLRFLGDPETIAAQIEEAQQIGAHLRHTVLSETEALGFWRLYHASETAPQWDYSLRLSGLPADLAALVDDCEKILPPAHLRAHAGNGIVRIHAPAGWLEGFKTKERSRKLAELRRLTQARGGQLVIQRAPEEVRAQLDVWGEVGATAALMRGLKERFDPQTQLNPGRFVAGI
jgi:glycolate oxidase FAD binding subunit